MKITVINKHLHDVIGGSELQCDLIAKELVNRGHTVNYVAPRGKKTTYDVPYQVRACGNKGTDIFQKIKESAPDIIYWRYNKHFFYDVAKRSDKLGAPFVFAASSISDLDPWFLKRSLGLKRTIKFLLRSHLNHRGFKYVDALTVNNEEFLGKLNFSPQYHIPNGMNRALVPFQWDRPYCAWISSIKQVKRPELVIKLAKYFHKKEIDFIMVGKVQESRYNKFINDDIPPNLHYLGVKSLEEVNGILNQAQVHIHTCYPEGFPNVFIQAWIQGTPSVSFGFDPNGLIEEHQMGYYTRDDWEEFRSRIEFLLENPDERKKMGENAKQFAGDKFLIEKTVDKLEEVISYLA